MGSMTAPPAKQITGYWNMFGHSYGMTTVGTLYQTGRFDAIVRGALDIEHLSWQNHCVTGAQVTNQGRSQGGYARVLQEITKSTRTAPYAANGGGYLFCWGINDIGISGNSSQMRTAWKHAMRTVISRARASSIRSDADASLAYGAGFTQATATQDFTSGSTIHRATSTTSATITLTVPADYKGETIAMCFIGAAGVFGGAGSWSGTASFASGAPTLSTSNIMASGTHCPVIQRFKGVAADAGKTLIFTATSVDASGEIDFNGYWIEADNPNPVIVCNIARLTTAGYAGYNTWSASQASADTDVGNFNSDLASVVAEYDAMVQIADIDTPLNKGVPPASAPAGVSTTLASDGVHPNEFGAALCADAVIAAIGRLTPTANIGQSAQLQVDAPQAAAARRPRLSGSFYIPEIQVWDGTAYTAVQGHLFAIPVVITEARERWIQFQLEQTNAPTTSGSSIRWGIYDDVGWTGQPQCLVVEATSAGALALGTTSGLKVSPASGSGQLNQPLDPGLYWVALKIDALGTTASTIRAANGPNPYMPVADWVAGTPSKALAWRVTGQAAGALPTTFPAGATAVGTAAGSCPVVGFKIF